MSSLEPRNAPSPSKPASLAPSNRLADAMQSAGICARNHPGYLKAKGETGPQDKPTAPYALTGPSDRREITFESYTPMVDPKHPGIFNLAPPDPSGDDARNGVVLYVGNTYLVGSTDGGATFTDHDPTAFLPAGVGHPVDQVMIYVPHRDLFCWMLQYNPSANGDGNFRLAVAHGEKLHSDVESGWTCYDFTSSSLGAKGVATDRQDLAWSETRLYMTTNLVGKGRVVMSLSLDDLANATTVSWGHTNPLAGRYTFSDLSQQNPQNVHMVALKFDTELEVKTYDDGAGTYGFNTVTVGKYPNNADLSSDDPDGIDWLTRGVANVSASVVDGGTLWTAWDASASADGESPTYPNAHVRIARIDLSNWTTIDERQVWNPDYGFAYGYLAVLNGDVGYGVAVGGKNDYPNSCFGILGDYVVYFRDTATATGGLPPRHVGAITSPFARPTIAIAGLQLLATTRMERAPVTTSAHSISPTVDPEACLHQPHATRWTRLMPLGRTSAAHHNPARDHTRTNCPRCTIFRA